ncbi:MAG: hypothetical protein IJM61_04960 [Firmicutes bacterium]|nr:hypothetical protein [Bacillota bacterium]
MNSMELILTKLNMTVAAADAAPLVAGTIVFLVPALMFTIRGITDKRGVMFAIHTIFLAFWVRLITLHDDEYLDALQAILRDRTALLVSSLVLAGSVLLWYVVISRYFPKKN